MAEIGGRCHHPEERANIGVEAADGRYRRVLPRVTPTVCIAIPERLLNLGDGHYSSCPNAACNSLASCVNVLPRLGTGVEV
jgi:hypothetical protein